MKYIYSVCEGERVSLCVCGRVCCVQEGEECKRESVVISLNCLCEGECDGGCVSVTDRESMRETDGVCVCVREREIDIVSVGWNV